MAATRKRGTTIPNLDRELLKKVIEEDKDFNASKLSSAIGYDKSYINNALSGSIKLSEEALKRICLVLRRDPEEFLLKEVPVVDKPTSKAEVKTPVSDIGMMNSFLAVLNEINSNLAKIASAVETKSTANESISKDLSNICKSLGVTSSAIPAVPVKPSKITTNDVRMLRK